MKALIKIGGRLLDDPASRASLSEQIAAVKEQVAVVHGGGKQMTRYLDERGIESRFVNGLRVTTEETVDAVLKVFAGTVNTQLVASLGAAGAKAVGLTGIDAGLAVAEQLDQELGFVGRVHSSDPRLLEILTAAGYLPVIACVAGGANGEIFNVNGDSMAVACAAAWKVDKLLFLTDVDGVLDQNNILLRTLTVADCGELIASGVATGGMQAKLNAAATAVNGGVAEVRIVRGSTERIVERVFAGETIGTRIVLR